MNLPFQLDRPLVFFDLETTGLDLKNDRIIELAFIKWTPTGDILERERRFNPGMPIPPEATAVHGITDADVADEMIPRSTRTSSIHSCSESNPPYAYLYIAERNTYIPS